MDARDFYDKRLAENPTIGSVELMEDFAKHVLEINFCDGSPTDSNNLTIGQLERIHRNVNLCVNWVNE